MDDCRGRGLFSLALASLLALVAAYLVLVIKGTGVLASLTTVGVCHRFSYWFAGVAAPSGGMPMSLAKTLSRGR